MDEIARRLDGIKTRIAAAARRVGREPSEVELVAVSKNVPVERIRLAIAAGQRLFGENYLKEAKEKIGLLADVSGLRWHFIGHLQSNKAKAAAGLFAMIETVDSPKLARLLAAAPTPQQGVIPVLVQVNISGEGSKSGVRPEDSAGLLAELEKEKRLQVCGLMTMPPWSEDPETNRPYFRALKELAGSLHAKGLIPVERPQLSMGMSDDFEVAIEEGATLVRVGTAIFGKREG